MLHSSDLKKLDAKEVKEALSKLSPDEWEELRYNWKFWARDNQLAPDGSWKVWLLNCGRGFGKTRTGTEWVREQIKLGYQRVAAVGPTKGSVRQVMIDGESGLLSVCHEGDKTYDGVTLGKPVWSPTNNTVTWANGAKVEVFSAEDPERLRGPQFEKAWCFIAGTKVLTPHGNKDVQTLEVNDLVLTSNGFQPIIGKSNRVMPVGTVSFSNGVSLTGTYEHPIWTQRGWVNLGELKESDIVCAIDALSGVVSGGIPTTTTIMNTEGQGQKDVKIEHTFIEKFMKKLMGLSQRVSTFITLMGTSSITTLRTLKLCQEPTTCACTELQSHSPQQIMKSSNTQDNVMIVEKASLEVLEPRPQSVKNVNTKLLTKPVKPQKSVHTVSPVLCQGPETSVVSVVSTWVEETEQTVYNLKVANQSEYFANGILTHNCDEICAWTRRDETWDMLQFCMRLGDNPQIVVTTTPKPDKLIRSLTSPEMVESGKVVVTQGTSYDNADNIDLDALKQYEGTRLGRQELYAEILTEAAGALWNKEMLEACQAPEITDVLEFSKDLVRIVVSIDPAVTSNKHSDLTGIIVAGLDINGKAYILEDATGSYTPEAWATKAIGLYEKYQADRIVAERNQGGDMVRHTLKTVDETIPITLVHASRGKYARAEPVSALYEQGKVFHVKGLMDLEDQMVTWEPLEAIGSPDRLDAMVWAITNLLLNNRIQPSLKLIYKPAQGFLN